MKSIDFTHKGQRKNNQDFVLIKNTNPETFLFLVADGMGGYEQGAVASKLVSENILTYLSTTKRIDTNHIQKAVNKSNLAIKQFKESQNINTGATVGGIIITQNNALCFWVGDVKIFHFKGNILQFESYSHTLMNDVVENGSISNIQKANNYKHVVTRSVQGNIEQSEIDTKIIKNLTNEDVFIVCSDGVHDSYDGLQLQQLLSSSSNIKEACSKIEESLLEYSKDNFSLISIYNTVNTDF